MFLVVFEGVDGTGKSTQVEMLIDYLDCIGKEVVSLFEPTKSTKHGLKLRKAFTERDIKNRLSFEEELELFIKDRQWNVKERIKPALDGGKIVVMDRYYFSTAAYQGARGIMDHEKILEINEAFAPVPDIIFLLVASIDACLERITSSREGKTYMEKKSNMERVQSVYKKIEGSSRYNIFQIDANQPVMDVHLAVVNAITRFLEGREEDETKRRAIKEGLLLYLAGWYKSEHEKCNDAPEP